MAKWEIVPVQKQGKLNGRGRNGVRHHQIFNQLPENGKKRVAVIASAAVNVGSCEEVELFK